MKKIQGSLLQFLENQNKTKICTLIRKDLIKDLVVNFDNTHCLQFSEYFIIPNFLNIVIEKDNLIENEKRTNRLRLCYKQC